MFNDGSIDNFNILRKNHIENHELSLKSIGDIVSTTSWLIHSTDIL